MKLHGLVHSPRLWPSDPRTDRRVTWMELFFDLIFVAAVAEVGSPLNADYSWPGLLRYSFLFVLIWWAWSGHTLYSTRFDHDDCQCRDKTPAILPVLTTAAAAPGRGLARLSC